MTFYNVKTKEDYDALMTELEAKGEKMLNTECKQCHKKWHHDNAKYCSMCGKKLIAEPEFKAGDIIASQIFCDSSFSLVQLDDDLINRITSVGGFWYIKRDCEINELSFGVRKECTRHATPEEVAEYEAALNFHKHGRKPFELKWGDMFIDGNSNRRIVVNSNLYTNGMFYKSGYKLLATVEEVNEWLGVADE